MLLSQTLSSLSGNWLKAIGMLLLAGMLYMVSAMTIIGPLFIIGAIYLGMSDFFLTLARGKEASVSQLFNGFNQFGKALGVTLIMIMVIMVGMVLFFIPGIIAALAFSQVYFVMLDKPELGVMDTLKESHEIMKGKKRKLFLYAFLGYIALYAVLLPFNLILLDQEAVQQQMMNGDIIGGYMAMGPYMAFSMLVGLLFGPFAYAFLANFYVRVVGGEQEEVLI
ncbi:hypothetical protein GCM10023331_31640 [Algivirga pacifica]|uniref:Glycerophosphoryl diester phosphodiesterase membrane domain-containing protein n=2 Tax=Algivirga pacifica TaxID=1162670 RepID=A0ABP9DG91_9BACT